MSTIEQDTIDYVKGELNRFAREGLLGQYGKIDDLVQIQVINDTEVAKISPNDAHFFAVMSPSGGGILPSKVELFHLFDKLSSIGTEKSKLDLNRRQLSAAVDFGNDALNLAQQLSNDGIQIPEAIGLERIEIFQQIAQKQYQINNRDVIENVGEASLSMHNRAHLNFLSSLMSSATTGSGIEWHLQRAAQNGVTWPVHDDGALDELDRKVLTLAAKSNPKEIINSRQDILELGSKVFPNCKDAFEEIINGARSDVRGSKLNPLKKGNLTAEPQGQSG